MCAMSRLVWTPLEQERDLESLLDRSNEQLCLIFKHSTRCPLSAMAKQRLERDWTFAERQLKPWYVDVLAHREMSNRLAERFGVHHESPQVLLIAKGRCFFDCSHLDISVALLAEEIRRELEERA